MIQKSDKIYIAGHRGMVGSACWRALEAEGYTNLIGKTSKELDLRDQKSVEDFIQTDQPVAIIDAAAKVGGILANDTYPYEFLITCLFRITLFVLQMKMIFRNLFSWDQAAYIRSLHLSH
jgi:nucleoside-diphosphate-sugar epimerase